ncbi:hypothetical protein A3D71_00470 [Candidatus Kaiserbacteria bacterium RIFCSPHIGHO2_02_FULL_55_20]|uniref:Uncharacterized protein n=1 Tax=Candidatus Kaiserbacteria bacterium RIFCSPHIGHO2_02_FULL_55_20 TaxID=1798497 RepID=A0A1F6DY19_9BACT|nr:MAG: hypothetical protein A2680_01460 [Candidatus Kaiserbacteria bacterium RIFCSPHIGHO2_01_FULL_55_37]OGG65892.1 MAG: hypothetical protein A3D71_00470 [Candidatus Kaiserbacteria bacterium RIFCSPHIGHO2_02_FULL_55_20]
MGVKSNCFLVASDGRVSAGIRGVVQESLLRIGPMHGAHSEVRFDVGPEGGFPLHQSGNLFEAASYRLQDGTPVLMGREGWMGGILSVSTLNLRFDPSRSTYFGSRTNGWPGVDAPDRTFVQLNERSNPDQHQLIALLDGEYVVVGDRGGQYIRVDCKGGMFVASPAHWGDFRMPQRRH